MTEILTRFKSEPPPVRKGSPTWQPSSPFVDTPFPNHLPPSEDKDQSCSNDQPQLPDDSPRKRQQTRNRQNKNRFRTTPVTFEEIREVDEEVNPVSLDENGNCNAQKTGSFHFKSKDDLQRQFRPRNYSFPIFLPKSTITHHRSSELLPQSSLEPIPELSSPIGSAPASFESVFSC